MRIAGSLWSVPSARVKHEARRLVDAGLDVWHWDRADGTLGPAGGFSASAAREIAEATGLRSEAHLMLADPRAELADWARFAELVIVHVESPHWRESIELIRGLGATPGIAVSPGSAVPDDISDDVAALIMTVAPGNAGTGFLGERLDLLDAVSSHALRGIDGSADLAHGRTARARGANWMVSGTALTAAHDPHEWLASARG